VPIYDYSCTACGHVTEVIHGINDPAPRFCPSCGSEGTLKKAFATPAVHFKGSGWAKKDRKATSAPGKTASSASKSADAGDGGGAGADKPAEATTDGGATPAKSLVGDD
jgi:putative FmdB family regulatory protein